MHIRTGLTALLFCFASANAFANGTSLPNGVLFPDSSGKSETFNPYGSTDLTNEFFQDLGANGRRCVVCHSPAEGWSIRPDLLLTRFNTTNGTDPIFRTNDGSNSPNADVSTVAKRRIAYSMLLNKGVIRVGLPVPPTAEFELAAVDDPYGYASAAELSLFRRPLPSTNLPFIVTVMWDGRETFAGQTLEFNLATQANDATTGHAQRPLPLPEAVRQSIVALELDLFTAQSRDNAAGKLDAAGARGGPTNLAAEVFDPANNVPGFDLFNAWSGLTGSATAQARASIARGQAQFNLARPAGTCTGCHRTHNVGGNPANIFFDVGISAAARRTSDMPLYTLRNKATSELRQTTDPGRALITGLWNDVDRFKAPNLRTLAARAPFFHDGSVATLDGVVDHYETRFGFTLTPAEQADLVAFLRSL